MKRTILTLCLVSLAFGQTSLAQRETAEKGPALVYQKDKRPVSDKRVSTRTEKLFDPNDKTRAVDFKIENIDVPGLEIVKQELSEKYQTMLIVVENKGARESSQSFVAITVKGSWKGVGKYGFPTTVLKDVYFEGKGVPKLKPNEQIKIWFDLTKSGVKFSDKKGGPFSDMPSIPFVGKYWIETVLVSEPIIVN